MENSQNSRPVSPTYFQRPSNTWTLLASWVVSVAVRILALISISGRDAHSGVSASQIIILIVSLYSIINTIQHLLVALQNSTGNYIQIIAHETPTSFFILTRLLLVLWLVTMTTYSVVISNPCLKGDQECSIHTVAVMASALADLLIIAHLTVLELYQHPLEMPWAVPVQQSNNYRADAFRTSPIGSCPASFSSASTLYDRETSRSSSRRPTIRRKPLPQATLAPGHYQNHPTPLLPSASVSGERQERHLTTLPNCNINERNDTMSLEQTLSIPQCSCGHIRDGDLRRVTQSPTLKRTGGEKMVSKNRIKKVPLFSTRSTEPGNSTVITNQKFSPASIPPPHKWNSSRTSSLSELLPVTYRCDTQSKPLDTQVQTRLRRRDKKNSSLPQPRRGRFPLSPDPDPYAINVPGAYTNRCPC